MSIELADSFMAIFGYRRIASQQGNVITPVFDDSGDDRCDICGDHHDGEIPRSCETGDGE